MIKCVEPTDSLTYGKQYKAEHRETERCYYVVNDNGRIRPYLKTRFEIVRDGMSELLNGKFVALESYRNLITKNKVYIFENGLITYDDGKPNNWPHKNIAEWNSRMGISLKPYKEYLTISELEFKQGKYFEDSKGKVWGSSNNDLYDENDNPIGLVEAIKDVLKMKFTEVNPNAKRIEELNKLIELEESYIRTSKIEIDNYNKEKEGLL